MNAERNIFKMRSWLLSAGKPPGRTPDKDLFVETLAFDGFFSGWREENTVAGRLRAIVERGDEIRDACGPLRCAVAASLAAPAREYSHLERAMLIPEADAFSSLRRGAGSLLPRLGGRSPFAEMDEAAMAKGGAEAVFSWALATAARFAYEVVRGSYRASGPNWTRAAAASSETLAALSLPSPVFLWRERRRVLRCSGDWPAFLEEFLLGISRQLARAVAEATGNAVSVPAAKAITGKGGVWLRPGLYWFDRRGVRQTFMDFKAFKRTVLAN